MSQLKVLRFDTEIKGNCKEKGYEDWILLEDFSFAGGRDVQMGGGGNSGIGYVSEISVIKKPDISSPDLFNQSMGGGNKNPLKTATLIELESNGDAENKYVPTRMITLTNPVISGYSTTSSSSTEHVQISYSKIDYKFSEYKDGKLKESEKRYDVPNT